jgi:hypothetical protein
MLNEGTLWEEDQILDLGFPWIDFVMNRTEYDTKRLKEKLGLSQTSKILVITSQEPMQEALSTVLSKVNVPYEWEVVIKLHPCEILSWKRAYKALIGKERIKFFSDNDINVYDLLIIADAHASFFSSVLWETPAFGLPNYIIDYPTKEIMIDVEELGLGKVSSIEKIFDDDFAPDQRAVNYVYANLDGTSAQRIVDFFNSVAKDN